MLVLFLLPEISDGILMGYDLSIIERACNGFCGLRFSKGMFFDHEVIEGREGNERGGDSSSLHFCIVSELQ
ncbi:MAG: hypothetical protein L3J39_05165 [Verrucomicrobiales bacterium]|nr:hypothetical protein [Verrucomicrobiales bacterium]